MAIADVPPKGGIVAELDGRDRRLVLRNAEIERFEAQHDLGIFAMLDRLLARPGAPAPQARHVRDLVALGLVGGGLPARAADAIVQALAPGHNMALRTIAQDLVMMAFLPEAPAAPKPEGDGSSESPPEMATDGTSPPEPKASRSRASRRRTSAK